jgi:hypothetical protein
MCPNRKVHWFETNEDWRTEDAAEVKRLVAAWWRESYAPAHTPPTTQISVDQARNRPKSVWASSYRSSSMSAVYDIDSLETYLASPLVSETDIAQAGGLLLYWEQARANRPKLAKMALDFLTAPGTSLTSH